MAIAALALRLATVRALMGRTAVGGRVTDSEIAPIDQRVGGEARAPALVVYTDDAVAEPQGRELIGIDWTLDLVVEFVVADQVKHQDAIAVTIPETDQGLELTLNLIDRQIRRVLAADDTPWARLWRKLVVRIVKIDSQRGAGLKDGVRFAARQLVLKLQPLAEPDFGRPAEGVWAEFLEALGAEEDLAELVPLLAAEIQGEALPKWRQIQAQLALTEDGVRGIGVAPPYLEPVEDPPEFARITIDGDDGERVIEPDPEA